MEASTLTHAARVPVLTGLSPHLRLQGDERLVALVRRGHDAAFEALVKRYQGRLLAFCRHMLRSNEDAEDVLQEVFTSAYKAICADDRAITVRPWLYRIARNRCLNHLRRPRDSSQESMDIFEREAGTTAADTVHRREEFRQVLRDVQALPEAQRSALLLREIDALSYDQIAEAMETTVPSVKSLLVRARMSLAEAAEARQLSCSEVRLELTQAAEGIATATPPTRRHVRSCERCRIYKRELRRTSRALAALYPIGPVIALKGLVGAKLGGAAGAGGAVTEGSAVGGATLVSGGGAAGAVSAGAGTVAAKAAAGLVAAALVTAGAVEVESGGGDRDAAGGDGAASVQATGRPDILPLPHAAPPPVAERTPTSDRRQPAVAEVAAPVEEAPAPVEETDEETAVTPAEEGEDTSAGTETVDSESTSPTDSTVIETPPGSSSGDGSSSSGGSGSTGGSSGDGTLLDGGGLVPPLR